MTDSKLSPRFEDWVKIVLDRDEKGGVKRVAWGVKRGA